MTERKNLRGGLEPITYAEKEAREAIPPFHGDLTDDVVRALTTIRSECLGQNGGYSLWSFIHQDFGQLFYVQVKQIGECANWLNIAWNRLEDQFFYWDFANQRLVACVEADHLRGKETLGSFGGSIQMWAEPIAKRYAEGGYASR